MKTRFKVAGVLTALGLTAVGVVGPFEGLRLTAYRDIVGVPTVCYGETRGVRMGDSYTREECAEMLGDGLVEFEQEIRKCLKAPDTIPDGPYISFNSLAYNIGAKAFCGSTLVRLANAGDLEAACRQLPRWNRAGGRVVKGLVNRRAEEMRICLDGLDGPVSLPGGAAPRPKPAAPAVDAEPAPVASEAWPYWLGSFLVLLAMAGLGFGVWRLVRRR